MRFRIEGRVEGDQHNESLRLKSPKKPREIVVFVEDFAA
jgi:hypothetical protein